MPSEHPKVTAYVPQPILDALDGWKSENNIESRSAAIVAILVNYLGVPYPAQHKGTVLTVPSGALSSVLTELAKLLERVAVLEQQVASTAPIEAPGIVPEEDATTVSAAQGKALSSAPLEEVTTASEVQGKAPSTVPTSVPFQPKAPLTQMALAKRLECSDKAVEKHRKQGKENFASWSCDRDPDNIAWTWEGSGGRGQPLRFMPLTSSD